MPDQIYPDDFSFRWRTPVEDYSFPWFYPGWSLMWTPKLNDTQTVKFGLDHAAQVSTRFGHEARTRYSLMNRFSILLTWECSDSFMRDDIISIYSDFTMGRLNPFWMPVWLEEFSCTEGISAGSSQVRIYPNGFDRICPKGVFEQSPFPGNGVDPLGLFILKKNGDKYLRPIAGCSHPEVIDLREPFPIDIPYKDIALVSRACLWHFSSGLTEKWISGINPIDRSGRHCELSVAATIANTAATTFLNGEAGFYDKWYMQPWLPDGFDDHHLPW